MSNALPRVVLYSRARCPLCDVALAQVREVRSRIPFELQVVDIAGDPALREAYRMDIPVLVINGERLFHHHIDVAVFEQRLRGGEGGHSSD